MIGSLDIDLGPFFKKIGIKILFYQKDKKLDLDPFWDPFEKDPFL